MSLLILDLEFVPNEKLLDSPSWKKKKANALRYGKVLEDVDACFNPVFGQVICFCGTVYDFAPDGTLVEGESLGLIDEDEEGLLEETNEFLQDNNVCSLVAHNGNGCDFPYLTKRFLKYDLPIPKQLNLKDKKPWETQLIDTMEILRFGSWGVKTSLDEACLLLDVPTPKDTFDSSSVWERWKNKEEQYILDGCSGDVKALHGVVERLLENKLM